MHIKLILISCLPVWAARLESPEDSRDDMPTDSKTTEEVRGILHEERVERMSEDTFDDEEFTGSDYAEVRQPGLNFTAQQPPAAVDPRAAMAPLNDGADQLNPRQVELTGRRGGVPAIVPTRPAVADQLGINPVNTTAANSSIGNFSENAATSFNSTTATDSEVNSEAAEMAEDDPILWCTAIYTLFNGLSVLLGRNKTNFFTSPASIHLALDLVLKGSAGSTRKQLAKHLGYPMIDGPDFPVSRFSTPQLSWMNSSVCHTTKDCGETYLLLATKAFFSPDIVLVPEYITTVGAKTKNSGVEVTTMDFRDPILATKTINTWAANATAGILDSVVSEEVIDRETKLLAVNVVYFKGVWENQFEVGDTKVQPFQGPSGVIMVNMMHLVGNFKLIFNEDYNFSALVLPYSGGKFAMILIKPDENMDPQSVLEAMKGGSPSFLCNLEDNNIVYDDTSVDLKVPRFTFSKEVDLKSSLTEMGIVEMFQEGRANFSNMSPKKLFVKDIVHVAKIEVNEQGSEASASTQITGAEDRMGGSGPEVFHLDKPFLFVIFEQDTFIPLFYGQVTTPDIANKNTSVLENGTDYLEDSQMMDSNGDESPKSEDNSRQKLNKLMPKIDQVSWCGKQHAQMKRVEAEKSICDAISAVEANSLCEKLTAMCQVRERVAKEMGREEGRKLKTLSSVCREYAKRCSDLEQDQEACAKEVMPVFASYTRECSQNSSDQESVTDIIAAGSVEALPTPLPRNKRENGTSSSGPTLNGNVSKEISQIIPKIDRVMWCSKHEANIRRLEAELSICLDIEAKDVTASCRELNSRCDESGQGSFDGGKCSEYSGKCSSLQEHVTLCSQAVKPLYDSFTKACHEDELSHKYWKTFKSKLQRLLDLIDKKF